MKNILPIVLLVVLVFFLIPNYKSNQEILFNQLDNGCLVYALEFRNALEAEQRLGPYLWTRTMAIQFQGTMVGHAVTVFVHSNITFVYDPNRGSFPVASYPLYDPLTIAEICFPKLTVRKAAFLEPTITLHTPLF